MARRKRWSGLGQIGRIPYLGNRRLLYDIWIRNEFSENIPDEHESKQGNYRFRLFKSRDTESPYWDMRDLLDLLSEGRLYAKSEDIVKHWRKRTVFNNEGYDEFIYRDGHLKLEEEEYFSRVDAANFYKFNNFYKSESGRGKLWVVSLRNLYHQIPNQNGIPVWKEFVIAHRYLSREALKLIDKKVEKGQLFTKTKLRCTN